MVRVRIALDLSSTRLQLCSASPPQDLAQSLYSFLIRTFEDYRGIALTTYLISRLVLVQSSTKFLFDRIRLTPQSKISVRFLKLTFLSNYPAFVSA